MDKFCLMQVRAHSNSRALVCLCRDCAHSTGSPGLHTTTRELQTCTFECPDATKHHQNSTRRPRDTKKSETVAGKGRKSAKFWALTLRGPTLLAPPFGPPPFGPPLFPGLGRPPFGSPPFGAHPSGPHPSGIYPSEPPFGAGLAKVGQLRLAKVGLAKVGQIKVAKVGQICLAKVGLVKVGIGQSRPIRMFKDRLAKVGLSHWSLSTVSG